jgi:hypothetical protein
MRPKLLRPTRLMRPKPMRPTRLEANKAD